MTTSVSGKQLYDSLMSEKESRHDTLYCNSEQYQRLADEAAGGIMQTRSGRSKLKIEGLNVIEFDRIDVPIVCERGDVFPLAEDWKE